MEKNVKNKNDIDVSQCNTYVMLQIREKNIFIFLQKSWLRVMQLTDHEQERRGEKSWMLNQILVVVYLQKIFAQAASNVYACLPRKSSILETLETLA